MRVTNDMLRTAFLSSLEQAQQRILRTQTQVATGLRVNQPSDDPYAAARIGELGASVARLEQYQANGGIARTRLGLEENALSAVIDNLQRVRELTVQANSDTLANSERSAIAAEIKGRLDSIVGFANAADASGNHLFAGYSEASVPFAVTPGGVVYNGDAGQRFLQVSDNRFVAVNDAGSEVFQRIVNGNGTFALAADITNTGTGVLGRGSVADAAAYVQGSYTITFVTAGDYEVRDGGGALVVAGTYTNGQSLTFPGASIEFDGRHTPSR
jgi:flagellar hook-associated protein 3 FlgL